MEVARSARCRVTSYARPGFDADWSFEITGTVRGGRSVLRIACKGQDVGTLESGLPGLYNLENLMGVIAAAHRLGVDLPHDGARVAAFPGRDPSTRIPRHRLGRHRDR